MFDLLVGGSTIAYLGAAHFVPLNVAVRGIRVQAAIRLTWLVLFHYFLGTARTRKCCLSTLLESVGHNCPWDTIVELLTNCSPAHSHLDQPIRDGQVRQRGPGARPVADRGRLLPQPCAGVHRFDARGPSPPRHSVMDP